MATTKKFTIKQLVGDQYVALYPKTTADQVIQDSNMRFVTDAQTAEWTAKQDALGYVPEDSANKGKAGGYASLDDEGKLLASQLPKEAIIDAFEVGSEEAMLALTAQKGDFCVRTDEHKTYILGGSDPSVKSNWIYLQSEVAPVSSVNGEVGAVTITADKLGALKASEVTADAQANKVLKLNADAKLPASITGDAATVGGKTVDNNKTDDTALWTANKVDTEIKNAVAGVVTSLDWKASVATFADIAITYPEPKDGWTVNVKDTDITYRYTGQEWVEISANAIPNASASVDGKMSKEDKTKLDTVEEGANNYVHPEAHAASMITQDDSHQFVTTAQKQQYDENTVYTNSTPTVTALGGIAAGTTFDNMPINEILTNLLYPYIAPTVSFSTNPGAQVREYGNPITEITLTAKTTKKSKPIKEVKFYKGSAVIETVAAPTAGGGTETFKLTEAINANTSFKASVSDGQTNVNSNTVSFTFVYPIYVGDVTEASPDQTAIKAMEKIVTTKPSSRAKSHTLTNSRFCIAYPASYGNLKSILDANSFEIIDDFVKETKSITGLDGTAQTYNVYTFKNLVTMTGFTVTYKF